MQHRARRYRSLLAARLLSAWEVETKMWSIIDRKKRNRAANPFDELKASPHLEWLYGNADSVLDRRVSLPDGLLYKYRGVDENLRRAIVENTLWAGPYVDLNDPGEGACIFDFSGGTATAAEQIQGLSDTDFEDSLERLKLPPEQEGLLRCARASPVGLSLRLDSPRARADLSASARLAILHTVGVCSFSKTGSSPAQFAYYSNNQQGVCLAYSQGGWMSPETVASVAYADQPPTIRIDDGDSVFAAMVLTKSKVWEHEQEARLVRRKGPREPPDSLVRLKKDALKAIILGPRCRGGAREQVLNWMKCHEAAFDNVPLVLRAGQIPGAYEYALFEEDVADAIGLNKSTSEAFQDIQHAMASPTLNPKAR